MPPVSGMLLFLKFKKWVILCCFKYPIGASKQHLHQPVKFGILLVQPRALVLAVEGQMRLTKQEIKQCYNHLWRRKGKLDRQHRPCFFFFSKVHIRRLLEFLCSIPCYLKVCIQVKEKIGWGGWCSYCPSCLSYPSSVAGVAGSKVDLLSRCCLHSAALLEFKIHASSFYSVGLQAVVSQTLPHLPWSSCCLKKEVGAGSGQQLLWLSWCFLLRRLKESTSDLQLSRPVDRSVPLTDQDEVSVVSLINSLVFWTLVDAFYFIFLIPCLQRTSSPLL